jgi:hypothetical protein
MDCRGWFILGLGKILTLVFNALYVQASTLVLRPLILGMYLPWGCCTLRKYKLLKLILIWRRQMNLKNAQFNDRVCMFCVKCKNKIKTYLFIYLFII